VAGGVREAAEPAHDGEAVELKAFMESDFFKSGAWKQPVAPTEEHLPQRETRPQRKRAARPPRAPKKEPSVPTVVEEEPVRQPSFYDLYRIV
jgi:hypothetical protein